MTHHPAAFGVPFGLQIELVVAEPDVLLDLTRPLADQMARRIEISRLNLAQTVALLRRRIDDALQECALLETERTGHLRAVSDIDGQLADRAGLVAEIETAIAVLSNSSERRTCE
jgi:hypothetical protein